MSKTLGVLEPFYNLSHDGMLPFCTPAKKFFAAMTQTLSERCPLKYARKFLSPMNMAKGKKKILPCKAKARA